MSINKALPLLLIIFSISSCKNNPYQQGERIYNELCSNCHMEDGSGLGNIIPTLTNNIENKLIGTQVCLILKGINADSLGLTDKAMPGYPKIKPVNLTNLINFINYEWNENNFEEQSIKDLNILMDSCK